MAVFWKDIVIRIDTEILLEMNCLARAFSDYHSVRIFEMYQRSLLTYEVSAKIFWPDIYPGTAASQNYMSQLVLGLETTKVIFMLLN